MPLFVSLMRVRDAILALQLWRDRVDSQNAKHLIHFLSAKKGGVNAKGFVDFSEADDKAFCDVALRVRSGDYPYFDPLDGEFRIETHPHSNVATARKKTFAAVWKAAELHTANDKEQWKFSTNYLDILKEKMIAKGGQTTRIPIYDLCAWLYRRTEFDDGSTLATVVDLFKSDYHVSDEELKALFDTRTLEGQPENEKAFFTHHNSSDSMLLEMVQNPQDYDLSDSIAEAYSHAGKSPVRVDDVVQLLLRGRKQLALQGPPGTGKTYLAKQSAGKVLGLDPARADFIQQLNNLFIDLNATVDEMAKKFEGKGGGWTIVQFHPSYTYEDFVRGLAPTGGVGGTVSFAVQDRTFAKICQLARRLSPQPIVLVIDEINRGDLSKVLGELIYGLEYRDEPVALQYAKSNEPAFSVPKNLFIITTLNTADRSIAMIDYAIRRRFDFIELAPDRTVIEKLQENSPIKDGALAIFDAVKKLLENTPDNAVGHSYFLDRDADALARSIVFQVLPLLAEYRVEGILGDADSIHVPGWPGKSGIPFNHERPFRAS